MCCSVEMRPVGLHQQAGGAELSAQGMKSAWRLETGDAASGITILLNRGGN